MVLFQRLNYATELDFGVSLSGGLNRVLMLNELFQFRLFINFIDYRPMY